MNKYQLKFWWEDWGKDVTKMIMVVVALIMSCFLGVKIFKTIVNQKSYDIVSSEAKTDNKNFAILNEQTFNTGNNNSHGHQYIVLDLFMKKPFMSDSDLNEALNSEVSEIKDKYNGSHNQKLRAIGIRLYDRKIVYDMGLTPRAVADYTLGKAQAENMMKDTTDNKNQQKMFNKKQLNQAQQNGIITQESPAQQCWDATLNNKKRVNYQQYALNVYGFHQYNKDAVAHPLSDQEFAFWLKLKMYQTAIGDSDDMDGAIKLYLNYDLNGNVDKKNFVAISQNFNKLNQREEKIGDETNYFPNTYYLKCYLAVYRPQLLYLIMTGQSVKNYFEAQKKIIDSPQGSNYKKVIQQHKDKIVQSVDKYGDPKNLYQGDPFVSLTGQDAVSLKSYPNLRNYPFSPTISQDNALYGLAPDSTTSVTDN